MADAVTLTRAMYRRRTALRARTVRDVRARWAQVDPDAITASWASHLTAALATVANAQQLAARDAQDATTAVLAAQGLDDDPAGLVDPRAFAGVASDGRDLATLLAYPTVRARHEIGRGMPVREALARGGRLLELAAATQVSDAGRLAQGVATAARRDVGGYYRYLSLPSCERCAILAGKWFRWNAGFQRHPRCDCSHLPAANHSLDDDPRLFSPERAFEAGQVRGLTAAEAQAVRDGASMTMVVNARRGARGLFTAEATTRRSYASAVRRRIAEQRGEALEETALRVGRRGAVANYVERRVALRPTPEAIYRYATSRDDAIRLLYANGYIVGDIRAVAARGAAA